MFESVDARTPARVPFGSGEVMTCAPSYDSYQPGHLPNLMSLCCPHEETLGP